MTKFDDITGLGEVVPRALFKRYQKRKRNLFIGFKMKIN